MVLIPLNRWVALRIQHVNEAMMEATDQRVRLMGEIIRGIRQIKMMAWEAAFRNRVGKVVLLWHKHLILFIQSRICISLPLKNSALALTVTVIAAKHMITRFLAIILSNGDLLYASNF